MWVRKVVWPGLRPLRTLFVHSQIKKNTFKSHFLNYGILSEECAQVLSSREKYLTMPLDKKRELYKTDYLQLKDILTWPELYEKEHHRLKTQYDQYFKDKSVDGGYPVNQDLNKKISIICGDITTLEIDAIVNAANNSLLGGGGVDGAIHKAAGPELVNECRMRNGCKTGECELTGGYLLPAKFVIHTVGPRGEKPDLLKSCYRKCLEKARSENIKTIAFPCISTGIYGYPQQEAALVALRVVRSYLEENPAAFDRIIFCTFLEADRTIYETLLQLFFPLA